MFKADHIGKSLQAQERIPAILELSLAVQRCRIKYDMVMYVRPISMRRHKERVLSFRVAHGKFIANLIRFFRSHLTRLKGLADLIGDDFMLLLPAGNLLILTLGEPNSRFGPTGI